MSLVQVRNLHKYYYLAKREIQVLTGLELKLEPGETAAVIGPSGVGKSTLLHLVGALDRPTRGEIFIQDVNLSELSDAELAQLRAAKIGFVFQFHHLLPEFTALENVILPAWILNGRREEQQRRRAEELLSRVGLAERLHHKPGELSGGELQRVALARALQNQPPLVLADEPTGNLDRPTAVEVQKLIFELAKEQNLSFLIVTHDRQFASRCDRVLQLANGTISEAEEFDG
ncbi:MAG: ABC transporter ATP-binding protein [bacterium]